jgi:hypothetical protein
MIALVNSDSAANIGDLFVDLLPVGMLVIGYHPSLDAGKPHDQYPAKNGWLAFYAKALSDATWR